MNDKYIAERLGIMENKIDLLIGNVTLLLQHIGITNQGVNELLGYCPVCLQHVKFTIATDGAPVRKCGCSTGIVPVDVTSYSPSTPAK